LLWTDTYIGPVEPHILDWLPSIALPVEVLNLNDGFQFYSTFVYDLVGIWSTIRALCVGMANHAVPPEKPNIRLCELRLSTFAVTEVIEWLLPPHPPNEQSSLCFLQLYEIPEAALPVLSIHGPSVSTLDLIFQPVFEFVHLFTKLEEFVVSNPRGSLWSSPLPAFPRTLRHIMFHGHTMSNSVVAKIAQVVTMLPDLCVLSIPSALTAHKHYPDLHEACTTHGVDILLILYDSSGIPVVSTHQRFRLVCNGCH
jgi:hypothetical protein